MRHALACLLLACASWTWSAEATKPEPKAPEATVVKPPVVTDPSKVTVTVTPSGAKYHTKDCKSAKSGKEETLKEALAAGLEPCALCHPPTYDPTKIVVYDGGDKGKKYHTKDCKFAKGETTLAKANEEGLEPCKVCNPPPLPETAAAKPAATKPATGGDDAPVKDAPAKEEPKK